MYGTAATIIGHFSVAPAVQDGLYTPEKHLFYLAMETFIYQYRKSIGMLNAYAEPFYPPTEENQHTEEIKKEDTNRNNLKEKKVKTKNDKISQINKPTTTNENILTKEENDIIEEDWVQVKRNIRTRVIREAIQEAYIKNAKNRYAAMKEEDEGEEENDNEKKLPMNMKATDKKHKTYNVNDITMNELIQHITEYKENEDIVNSTQDKTKAKKNTNNYYKTYNKHLSKPQEEKEDDIIDDNDSESDEESDDDDSSIEEDDRSIDDDDLVESFNIEDLNEEEKLYVKRLKDAVENTVDRENIEKRQTVDSKDNVGVKNKKQMERIRYQNNLLLFRLEQAEEMEKRLNKDLQVMKEESSKKTDKIAALESVLKKKTELLVNALRNK